MKAVILPIMFKTMVVMTSISVLMSLLSLIISSITGFTKHALYHIRPSYKVFHIGAGTNGIDIPHEYGQYDDVGNQGFDIGVAKQPDVLEHEPVYYRKDAWIKLDFIAAIFYVVYCNNYKIN